MHWETLWPGEATIDADATVAYQYAYVIAKAPTHTPCWAA